MHVLDNPIWHALRTRHARFAEGDGLALRYPRGVSPLAGLSEVSPGAYGALLDMLGSRGKAALFLDAPADPPLGVVIQTDRIAQMVWQRNGSARVEAPALTLGPEDVPEMVRLARLTQPGPFAERTRELGRYIGIREDGVLVAMAGERLRLDGYTEVSAVCTLPTHRGHGHATALVSQLVKEIAARGETPFLHVRAENPDAIRVYERLGFVARRELYVSIVANARGRA